MLHSFLMVIDVFCAVGIIALVLVQRGKGADAGAGFGAGASGTVFGARGAGTALSRATAILAAVFMLSSLALAYTSQRAAAPASILDDIPQQEVPVAPAAPASAPTTGEVPVAPVPAQ
jgi:preprotein translocase subunit SecG